jgi:GT2 family glycosyltransferase
MTRAVPECRPRPLRAPCSVVHLQVGDDPPAVSAPARSCLAVLWDGDVPVGQLVLDPADTAAQAAALLERAAAEAARSGSGAPENSGAGPERPPSTVSVVICTRDRPETLARCLASIVSSSMPPDEIVVVDNAPRVAARDVVARFPGVRYVLEPEPGLSIARNAGIRATDGALVAFTDDDALVHRDWLRHIREPFANPAVAVVTGLVLPAELDTEAQVLFERHLGFGRGYARRTFDARWFAQASTLGAPTWDLGAGVNMCLRRSVLDGVGGFDVRLGPGAAGCSDDSELWYRVVAAGHVCVYTPAAVVEHVHRRDLDGLRRQVRDYMRGHATALLIQFEGNRHRGNLRRLLLVLPKYYAIRAVWAVARPHDPLRLLFGPELRGYLEGIFYYVAHRRKRGDRRRVTPAA